MGSKKSDVGRSGQDPWERILGQLDSDDLLDTELSNMAVEAALPPGSRVVRARSSAWMATGVEGVRCKILAGPGSTQVSDGTGHPDSSARRILLISMDAGAVYPGHDHPEVEETFMLSGDLGTGEVRLGPGDFQSLPAGSIHPTQRSETGCLCIVICSADQRR